MNIPIVQLLPPWLIIEDWLARLEYTLYYQCKNGPQLLTHARSLRENVSKETENHWGKEFCFCSCLMAAKGINKICFCNDKVCTKQCVTLFRYIRLPEIAFNEIVDEVLISVFNTDNKEIIYKKLEEFKLQKIK